MRSVKVTFKLITFLPILLHTVLTAQEDSVEVQLESIRDTTFNNSGFLVVECDSPGINIYVDEMLVGQIPIDYPIPLSPGKHTVTYLQPRLVELLNQYYEQKEVERLISKSLQEVYIIPGQTVSVNLWWRPFERELRLRKYRFWTKSIVGIIFLVTFLSLNIP